MTRIDNLAEEIMQGLQEYNANNLSDIGIYPA